MRYEYLLFDLDGTLTKSHTGIVNCVQYALQKNGIMEEDREKLLAFVGPPLVDSFQEYYGASPELADKMVRDYRERFNVIGWKENEVYPGIEEMLQTLKADGRRLLVATSKPEVFAKKILEYFGLDGYFERIVGASPDDKISKKADVIAHALSQLPRGITAMMVGDRCYDVNGAKENSLPCIGVLYGYGNKKELEEAGAVAIVPQVGDFFEILFKLEQ